MKNIKFEFEKSAGIAAFFIFLSLNLMGCSNGSAPPPFGGRAEDPAPSVATPPSVDEALAEEAGTEKLIYHVGPVDLPARADVETMIDRPLSMRFQTSKELWVTGFKPKVVNANGEELPAELLHQAIVFNMREENPLCAGAPNPFLIASSILSEINLPQGYGYPILPADPIEASVILKNPTDVSYIDVFFEFTLTARPMSELADFKDVKPVLVEMNPCDHATIEAPPHEVKQQNATYQVPMKSKLVSANAVLQDFGSAIELTKGGEIMPFWRAESILDNNHHVTALTGNPFEDSEGIEFGSADRITLGVSYDNSSDLWLKGATAGAMIYLAPKD